MQRYGISVIPPNNHAKIVGESLCIPSITYIEWEKMGFTTDLHGNQRKSPSAVSLQQKGDVHKYKSIYLPNILVMIKQ